VATYQQEYRGVVGYYRMAFNLHRLGRLRWVMETSLTKTLARKLRLSVRQVYRRFRGTTEVDGRTYKVLRATVEREGKRPLVAEWGGIPLRWRIDAALDDDPARVWSQRTDLERRLLADECELCGSRHAVEVHHIRALKDLRRRGRAEKPEWVKKMAARQRKTLVVCRKCHEDIHYGRPAPPRVGPPATAPPAA
jgi:hypothetical protein